MSISSWLELSERAYATNVATFRAVAGPSRVGAVLKGNAYGHGLTQTLSLAQGRVEVLYVITPAEALAIRSWEVKQPSSINGPTTRQSKRLARWARAARVGPSSGSAKGLRSKSPAAET